MCRAEHRVTAATVCDHITPHKGNYAMFLSGPFQSLCASHHNSDKQEIDGKGFSTRVGNDGWPLSDYHPANRGKM